LQLKIPEEIITWKSVHTALNALKPAETILQAAAIPPPLSQKQGQSCSLLKFKPTYDEIPNPTREMREVNLPEPDDPLNPEKWEVGCKIRHPGSVQQGPSTAICVPDLRSKQGEFQHKTVQSLRRCTAAVPAATTPDGSGNLTPGGAHSPLRATSGAARPRSGAARTIFLIFKALVGKSVYNSITAVELLVDKQLDFIIFPGFRWPF